MAKATASRKVKSRKRKNETAKGTARRKGTR